MKQPTRQGFGSGVEDPADSGQLLRYGPAIDPATALLGHQQAGLSQDLWDDADGGL